MSIKKLLHFFLKDFIESKLTISLGSLFQRSHIEGIKHLDYLSVVYQIGVNDLFSRAIVQWSILTLEYDRNA